MDGREDRRKDGRVLTAKQDGLDHQYVERTDVDGGQKKECERM